MTFILQFLLLSILFGIPLFVFHVSLGQYLGSGVIDVWRISPIHQVKKCCTKVFSVLELHVDNTNSEEKIATFFLVRSFLVFEHFRFPMYTGSLHNVIIGTGEKAKLSEFCTKAPSDLLSSAI